MMVQARSFGLNPSAEGKPFVVIRVSKAMVSEGVIEDVEGRVSSCKPITK